MSPAVGPETPGDRSAVAALVARAFGRADEAMLVEALRLDGAILLSLAARDGDAIVGHVAFQPVAISGAPGARAASLAPLAVDQEHRRRGIGAALVRAGLERLAASGVDLVFVLGDPAYYRRFGFSVAAAAGFHAPWSGPHFMALALTDIAPAGGALAYPAAFFPETPA